MGTAIDLGIWPRAQTYHFFRGFERPHYAITTRIDVTKLMEKRAVLGMSTFRSSLWAIGKGINDTPALRLRFKGDTVTRHDSVVMSPAIDAGDGTFRYCYIPWLDDFTAFDAQTATLIEQAKASSSLDALMDQDDVAFLSCLPWLDYTSLDNALPHAEDCTPRISWGKIVGKGDSFDMAMTLQSHHALVDGRDVADFFAATQNAFDAL